MLARMRGLSASQRLGNTFEQQRDKGIPLKAPQSRRGTAADSAKRVQSSANSLDHLRLLAAAAAARCLTHVGQCQTNLWLPEGWRRCLTPRCSLSSSGCCRLACRSLHGWAGCGGGAPRSCGASARRSALGSRWSDAVQMGPKPTRDRLVV